MRLYYADQLVRQDFYVHWITLPPYYSEIDPFAYSGRLAVLKLLIDALNVNGAFGAQNERNPLWGYVFQLAWQRRSGRLQLAHTAVECIDPHSLWGYVSYSLSVIPLIAAINSGLITPLTIPAPHEPSEIDYAYGDHRGYVVPPAFSPALAAWSAFFTQALELPPGADLAPVCKSFWHAHIQTVGAVQPMLRQHGPAYHAPTEISFLSGWLRMSYFLGAAAWRTDLDHMLQRGLGILPERVLTDEDEPGHIPNMSPLVNRNIADVVALSRQALPMFAIHVYLWRRAMRSAQARTDVFTQLDALLNPSRRNRRHRLRLLKLMVAWHVPE